MELRPKNAFVIDFDALQQDEAKLNEISNIVLNKLKMQIPDMRALSKIIVKWQEEQIKSANHLAFKDFTPENELVGGIFNDIFLEMVQKAGKHVALAYSVDFKKFANIVNYIASNIEYYDEGAGNDLYDFLLHAQYIDHVEFVTICNVNNFATELEVFRQAHDGCKFNLNVKAMNGRPLICELMDRISGCTPQQIKEVLDVVMNKDVVEVNWTASDNVVLYHYPVPVGVQIATIEPVKYHHSAIEKLYNTFAHTANSEAIITFMISILSDPAVYASQAAHDFIQHISTPGYGPMNMVHAEIFKAIVESKGTIDIAKVKDAELFITFFQMPDFAERLDTFVQKHGSLDMSMKTLSGKPMLLHMIETVGVHFETALTLMNNPNITNVDWCATDAEGHSVIEKLYQKSANMPMPADGRWIQGSIRYLC